LPGSMSDLLQLKRSAMAPGGRSVVAERGSIILQWARLSRVREWAQSKVPFIAAAALLLMPSTSSAWRAIAIVATIVPWAAFGYGINDLADRRFDERAGKPNRAAGLTPASWAPFLILTAGGAVGLSLLWAADAAAPALVLAGLALAAAYSVPPIRLKERGVLGLIAAAAAQWAIPILAASAAVPGGWLRSAAWSLALVGLALGTRWILIHQLEDASADRRAMVTTYASRRDDAQRLLVGIFACELVMLAVALALTWPRSIPAVVALGAWVAGSVLLNPRRGSLRVRLRGYHSAPLAGYYFVLLPVALALTLQPLSPTSFVLAAALLALGGSPYLLRAIGAWRDRRPLANDARA
jgi:4-hydroxybenzoate polyprenyltransferase